MTMERNTAHEETLKDVGFTIFEEIYELGFFGWQPGFMPGDVTLDNLKSAKHIVECVDEDQMPPEIVETEKLNANLPTRFLTLPPQEHANRFPYNKFDIASLYVAKAKRGVDLDTVDFMFGGSTLEFLANKKNPEKPGAFYAAVLVPSTNIVMVKKVDDYIQNYADPGFQFSRLVTGRRFEDVEYVDYMFEHMQTIQMDGHKVFFKGESDAIHKPDGGTCVPVETKANNPWFWGTKVMFQLISNGSSLMIHGKKGRGGYLNHVRPYTLKEMCETSTKDVSISSLEQNLRDCLNTLRDAKESVLADGSVHVIHFANNEMQLRKYQGKDQEKIALFPNEEVCKELFESD
uniref:Decapping nuclease n=1 Tax=Craspedostauros australis TaxID=1486917 RepID=A0A7R9ZMZ6_9STRA